MKLKAVILTASFVGLPLAAVAAQHETRPAPAGQAPGQAQQPSSQQNQQRQAGGQPQAAQEPRGLVASDAIQGMNVRDQTGQQVGSVHRVVVDQKSGEIRHVILATGGVLGIGRDHVQLSWDDIRLMRDNGNLVAQVDRQRLDQAPAVEGGLYDRRGDARMTAPPATVPPAARPDAPAAAGDQRAGNRRAAEQRAAGQPRAQADPNLITLNELGGTDVRDQQRRDIGSIERLMINPAEGRIRYAVIGTGGFLGIGRDQILVPWDNLQLAWDNNELVLSLDQRILEQAPRAWVGREEPSPAAAPRDPGAAQRDRAREQQERQQEQQPPRQQSPSTR